MQQTGEEAVTQLSGIRNDDLRTILFRIGEATLIGTILGFGAGGISSIAEEMGVKSDLKKAGLNDKQVDIVIKKVSQKTLESGEVQREVARMLSDEIGSISATQAQRTRGFKEIKQMFDEQAELQKIERVEVSKKAIAQIENLKIRGRVTQLVSEQNEILAEIDQLEKIQRQEELDLGLRGVSELQQKKLTNLQKRLDNLDLELAEVSQREQTKDTKIAITTLNKQIAGVQKDIKTAEKSLEQARALEARNLAKVSKRDVKRKAVFSESIQDLIEQFDVKDAEIAEILIDNDIDARTGEAIKLRVPNLESLERTMVREFNRGKKSAARLARLAEKRRITEIQKIIRQIKKSNILEITAEARIEIERLQKFLKDSRTLNQLRALNAAVQKTKAFGKEQLAMIKEGRRLQFEARKEALLKALEEKKPRKKGVKIVTGPQEGPIRAALRSMKALTLRSTRLFDLLDSFKDFKGAFSAIYYDTVNRAFNKEVAMTSELTAKAVNWQKDNKISREELGTRIEADGVNFTMSEAMHVYGAMQNPDDAVVLIYGNAPQWGVAEPLKTIEKVINQLPEKFKNYADQLINEMGSHYDRTRLATLAESDGKRDLIQVEGTYIPRKRLNIDFRSFEDETLDEMKSRSAFRRAFPSKSITKPRVRIPNEFQTPIYLGLIETYHRHTANREHFIAMSRAVKDLQRLTNDPEIKKEINSRFGPEFQGELQKYVNRVAVPTIYKTHSQVEKAARSLRQAAAIVHLGFNVVTIGKQLPSIALALGEVGFAELSAAITEVVQDFQGVNKFVNARDPQMANRQIEREIEEQKRAVVGDTGVLAELRRRSFDGIKLFDRIAVTIVWKAKYNQLQKPGTNISEAEAIEEAQKTVLRTQPAASAKDIAGLYAESEFLNIFTQFTNQLSQIFNIATHDIPGRVKLGRNQAAILGGVGIMIQSLLIFAATHGRLPEDEEDITEAFTETLIASIPLIGPVINSSRKGFQGLPATIDLFVVKPFKFVKAVVDLDTEKAIKEGGYFVAGGFKVPFTQIYRSISGGLEVLEGETDDLRRLIWSDWALNN